MKKGFTLIEVLAVLVLIAIISTIVVLNFDKRTDRAEHDQVLTSSKTYIREITNFFLKQDLKDDVTILPGTYSVNEPNGDLGSLNDLLDLDGDLPIGGNVTVGNDYYVTSAVLTYKNYEVTYANDNYDIKQIEE